MDGVKTEIVAECIRQILKDKLVVGVDPGESTGIVTVRAGELIDRDTLSEAEWRKFILPLIKRDYSGSPITNVIWVVESYLEYHSSRGGNAFKRPAPSEIIGTIKLYHSVANFKLIMNHANAAKSMCPDDLLRHVFDIKKLDRHQRDALRHVVAYALSLIGGKIMKQVQ